MSRQFQHIELTTNTALLLREAVRPYSNLQHAPITTTEVINFCTRVYLALIDLETREEGEGVNIFVSLPDCFLINTFVGVEDNEDARGLLRQTWAVIYEYEFNTPPSLGASMSEFLAGLSEQEEPENAEGTTT